MTVPSEVKLDRHTLDLDDDGHDTYGGGLTGFVSKIEGGQDTVKPHGAMGAAVTFDPTDGNVHTGTLNANCTVTLDPPVGTGGTTLIGWFTQSGGPWTLDFAASGGGTFAWEGTTPTIPTTGEFRVVLERIPGTTNDWVGVLVGGGTTGTVTSVAVTVPAEFSVAGSPVTTSGTLAITKAPETANTVWAGPTSGSAAQPAFRALVAADIPAGLSAVTDHEHIVNVVFSGDASATVWELPAAPVSDSSIAVYIAGSRSIAWVLSGTLLTTLTFDSAPASATNNIVIDIVAATA